MHDSNYVMTWTTALSSISNTLNKLLLQYDLHSSYNQTKYISEEEIIHKIFSTYIEPLLNYINHTELIQEWKLNIDAPEYEKTLMLTWIDLQIKKMIIMIGKLTGQSVQKKQFSGFLFTPLWIILQVSLKHVYH